VGAAEVALAACQIVYGSGLGACLQEYDRSAVGLAEAGALYGRVNTKLGSLAHIVDGHLEHTFYILHYQADPKVAHLLFLHPISLLVLF
jgi:hypothetical protein